MEMSPEILVPILIVAGAIVIFIVRRWSEEAPMKRPAPSEVSAHQEAPALQDADRLLIAHPLIRRAAERALSHGGEGAKFIERDGDRIYFNFGRIEDPVQRQNAVELIRNIQDGGKIEVTEAIQIIRRLFTKSAI